MSSQGSSLEMDCSNSQDLEGNSQTDMEMTSASSSLESNMDVSENLEGGNEEGNDGQDDTSYNDSSGEGPPTRVQSPITVHVSVVQVQVKSADGSPEVSSDYGSQEDASCRGQSPITVKVRTTSTTGSPEASANSNNGSHEFVLNGETKICLTLSRENSDEKRSKMKRRTESQEEEGIKEKKIK